MSSLVQMPRRCALSISRMFFRCDLRRADSRTIPLASFTELLAGRARLFGMVARVELSHDDLHALPGSWRESLLNPAEYLDEIFVKAWKESESGKVLDYLSAHFHGSLYVEPPRSLQVANGLVLCADGELDDSCQHEVVRLLRSEIDTFLAPRPTETTIKEAPLVPVANAA